MVPPAPVKIEKFGLTIDLPGAAQVADGALEAPIGKGVRISGEEFGGLDLVDLARPVTPDEAKIALAKTLGIGRGAPGPVEPTNPKTETLPDGFATTYTVALLKRTTGENVGDSFGVDVYRTIGGKVFHCFGSTIYDRVQPILLAACKSLR